MDVCLAERVGRLRQRLRRPHPWPTFACRIPVRWLAKRSSLQPEAARSSRNLSIRYKPSTTILRCPPPVAEHRLLQVPVGLQPHPQLRRCLEEPRQSKRGVGRDAPLPEDQLVEPVERHAECLRRLDLPDPHRLQILLQQQLSRVNGRAEPARVTSDRPRHRRRRHGGQP